jgi:hypothetical protein
MRSVKEMFTTLRNKLGTWLLCEEINEIKRRALETISTVDNMEDATDETLSYFRGEANGLRNAIKMLTHASKICFDDMDVDDFIAKNRQRKVFKALYKEEHG